MGVNNLTTRNDGDIILSDDVNQYKIALGGNLVPRNTSGVPTANAGELGTSTYPFKRGNITTGYFFCGQIIMFHDFGGALSPGQGWMKCNGNVVNETNYNAIHGTGSWGTYAISSPLSGKHLPNFNGKYGVGTDNTTKNGSSAITSVGNSGHQTNLRHTHTAPAHNHKWAIHQINPHRVYPPGGGPASPPDWSVFSFDRSGNESILEAIPSNVSSCDTFISNHSVGRSAIPGDSGSFYTSNSSSSTLSSALSNNKNIQPESIEVEYWIRII